MEKGEIDWSEDLDIAYGRKTWAIENYLACKCDVLEGDWLFLLNENAWNDFYNEFMPIYDDLKLLAYRVGAYIYAKEEMAANYSYSEDQYITDTAKLFDLMDERFPYSVYQLGVDWEARAVCVWLEADAKIRELFAAGEEIVMEVSY